MSSSAQVRLARAYLEACGLRALFLADWGGVVRLGTTADPAARQRALAREGAEVTHVWWTEMKANGQLRKLNSTYKAEREAAAERGEKVMPYPAYIERYKVAMAKEIAARAS